MPRDSFKFSCGHEFVLVAVPEQSKKISVMTPNKMSKNRKESLDQCPECKYTAYEAEKQSNAKLLKIQKAIDAHKAHADFLKLQGNSPAARADMDLRNTFAKCYHNSLKSQAAKIKEMFVEEQAQAKAGGDAEDDKFPVRVQKLQDNLQVIEHAARHYPWGLPNIFGGRYHTNGLPDVWSKLINDINDLRSDYDKFSKEGFETRLKTMMEKAAELSK
ncbi:hypothetical protein L207DRAFT_623408 [Hyaloscypha variabilis F]|uniref:Uncharacterized protein n=1 Tax=Hyaloscypha variabilis (strain UAMH 11265 / GT02V1 / F) TaxID=1149755 RepID=A0A2J6RRR8_HYAVF|nr:hypothetical protein L207DRAFT_623408 [Hyaloscypha variabilis F]